MAYQRHEYKRRPCAGRQHFGESVTREDPSKAGSFVQTAGKRVFYRKAGSGQPIILLHGFPASSYNWRRLLPPLSKLGMVIAPDIYGFGYSDALSDPVPAAAKLAGFMESFTSAMKLDRFALAGHDWGGAAALAYAVQNPSKVSKLVLMNMSVYPDLFEHVRTSPDYAQVRRLATSGLYRGIAGRFMNRRQVKQLIAPNPNVVISEDDLDNYLVFVRKGIRNMSTLYSEDSMRLVKETQAKILQSLPGFDIPTSIIWAKNDPFVPLEHAGRLNRDIRNSKLTFLEDTGHFLMEEKPNEVETLVAGFLGE